jgi:hypothetical protein
LFLSPDAISRSIVALMTDQPVPLLQVDRIRATIGGRVI